MSDVEDNKLPVESELPPYRQTETLASKPSSKFPLWLLPVLAIVLIIGVLVGKYWGNDKSESSEIVAAPNTQSNSSNKEAASTEQAVLSVETVTPSQDSIGNTLSADGTISAKDIANVSAKVNGVAIERILV